MKAAPRFNQALFQKTFRRVAAPYSLREIAVFTGVSVPTLSRLERSHTPGVDVFLAVCAWMGVAPGVFTDGSLEVRESSVCLACVHMRTRLAQIEELARG